MQTTVLDCIRLAKAYVDDEHSSVEGWIPDSPTWLYWLNVEYAKLYRAFVSQSLISADPVDHAFTADGSTSYVVGDGVATNVLAICSVHEDLGNGNVRFLAPMQPSAGQFAGQEAYPGTPTRWSASGMHDFVNLKLRPVPAAGNYVVRYIPDADILGLTDTIDLPGGMIDRVILGMANRALIKEGSASAALYGQLKQADEDLAFMANSRILGAAPGARKASYWQGALNKQGSGTYNDPSTWWWYSR